MKLNKQIRKTILETKEQKEKFLIEQSLVKKRLEMIVSNVKTIDDYNKLSETKQLKLNCVICFVPIALMILFIACVSSSFEIMFSINIVISSFACK
jgi:phospholipid N-methyltransferase